MFSYTAPSEPPDTFQADIITARAAMISWDLPVADGRNGIVIDYTLTCYYGTDVVVTTTTNGSVVYTLEDLRPASLYECNVTASTSAGEGPPASLSFTTSEDGKCSVRFTPPFALCISLHIDIPLYFQN